MQSNFIINRFVRGAILGMAFRSIDSNKKTIIHSDIVPPVKGLRQNVGLEEPTRIEEKVELKVDKNLTEKKIPFDVPQVGFHPAPRNNPAPSGFNPQSNLKYGKLTPLIMDPSVTGIECPGPGKQVNVFRGHSKQVTKIFLSKEEIDGILEKFSEASHVPVMEGIFRVIVENFSVNAIVSEMIGSKFVIKKM